ncbi:MAG: MCE family protein [Streptosporangiaceae bacterium]
MNPIPIGAIGLAVGVIVLVLAFNVQRLPVIGGTVYHAAFHDAAGLAPGDDVRIAGVKVGKVDSVELAGSHVAVDFRVDSGTYVGDQSDAAIKIATVLGAKYLALQPKGERQLPAGDKIPLSRTTSPYDVMEALQGLTHTVEGIDTKRLAKAFDTLSSTFRDTPPEVRASLRGLTRLSQTIASRDQKLHELLDHAHAVTQVLADRNQAFTKLLADGNKLLKMVERRRAVIHQLLIHTVRLSQQLVGLVQDNQQQLAPALRRLDDVVHVLLKNQRNLQRSIRLLAPFVREFTDTLGNGRWFDNYIQNLVPLPASVKSPRN